VLQYWHSGLGGGTQGGNQMDFYTLLDHVIDLLRQRQRVTYRALRVQFHLDDEALEALKEELVYGQRLATDEEGRVLVWTAGADLPPRTTPSAPQPLLSTVPQDARVLQAEAPPAMLPPPEAERRQLTVLFCDLVDSTRLARQLDPEDLREVIRAYQATCAEVIQRFEGHIAQYLGDGLLVYFGYPQAHEDDAYRAVRTGLGMVQATSTLNTQLEREKAIRLAVRIGIHTGLVVVGEMGGGGRQEQLALGDTPNIAARLQGLATPDTAVISETTSRLVQGYFVSQTLGAQELKGLAQPLVAYRVLHASEAQTRLAVAALRGLTPLVGREAEVKVLLERWAQVKAGMGHIILLQGEAGIGKSRLVYVLQEQVAAEPHTRWECRCSSYYRNTALYPLVDLVQRILGWQPGETPQEKLHKLEATLAQYRFSLAETVPLVAPLVALPLPEDRYPPLRLTPQRQRQKTLDTLLAIVRAEAGRHPVLFIVENLHWVDPSTLEWLTLLLDQVLTVPILVMLTSRPDFQPPWSVRDHMTSLVLPRLSPPQIESMVARLTREKPLPPEVVQHLLIKTDGVPLFVEELTKMVLEAGVLPAVHDHDEFPRALPPLAIPASLHDALMARLDRLSTVKSVAQLGAVLGREFSYEFLQAVTPLDARTLQHALARLVDAELLYQQGQPPVAQYTFKHALIQDTAYQSLLKSTRQQYHQRIAQVLEARFAELVETQPELLAHHYTEAGLVEQAIRYWLRAGESAMRRSSNVEAIGHLTQGLDLLKALPQTMQRAQHELVLHITLGAALLATKGYGAPEVEHTYTRAHALCQQVGETPQLFPVLHGLWSFHLIRAEFRKAAGAGAQYLTLAQHLHDTFAVAVAHLHRGFLAFLQGEGGAARAHFDQGLALYNPLQHSAFIALYTQDLGVSLLAWLSLVLWWLGYPDQALQRSHEAVALGQRLAHPYSLAFARLFAVHVEHFRREVAAMREHAEVLIALATDQGFAVLLASGSALRGWALATQASSEAGLRQLEEGMAAYQAAGMLIYQPYFLGLLAETYGNLGQAEAGVPLVTKALEGVSRTGECFWESELYRIKGELCLRSRGRSAEAERSFHQALAVARRQEAKSLELRVALSLARLWQQQGKQAEAHALLAPIYGWFTEGFDTADLQDAKALLEELA
jgi:class 3 adenylate cyclase/predicted ATPase